ncbi:MAG TPA: alpha/beta hydrolase [Ktedonobacteraceae bacterium]|jgi:pimeloyl-ACP methyl ester carboxylesterase
MVKEKGHLQEAKHLITIARQQIFYRVLGQGSPLVLIHGFGVSGHIWQPMLPYLAQKRQVFIVDLPGYGKSTFTPPWRLREMAPVLITLLRELNLTEVALAGQSMGGAIALHMSVLAPELVERVVLISAAGVPLNARLPRLAWRSLCSSLQPGNGNYPRELIRDILRPRPLLFWQNAREMVRSDFRAEITALTTPALIIWGEADLLLPISLGRALHTALPHATFVTLPNCGHRPMLAHPELLSTTVLDFLAE